MVQTGADEMVSRPPDGMELSEKHMLPEGVSVHTFQAQLSKEAEPQRDSFPMEVVEDVHELPKVLYFASFFFFSVGSCEYLVSFFLMNIIPSFSKIRLKFFHYLSKF